MSTRKLRVERIEHDAEIAADVISIKFSRNLSELEGFGLSEILKTQLNAFFVRGRNRNQGQD